MSREACLEAMESDTAERGSLVEAPATSHPRTLMLLDTNVADTINRLFSNAFINIIRIP